MARLSAADAKKLGIRTSSGAKTKQTVRRKSPRHGRSRLPVVATGAGGCEFHLDLPHNPKPKERPRTVMDLTAVKDAFIRANGSLSTFLKLLGNGKSRTFTPKTTAAYEDLIALTARGAMRGREPLECALSVEITFTLIGDPDEWPTSNADGDVDNMAKAVFDGLNGIVFNDDRQVVETLCRKRCDSAPSLHVKVSEAVMSAA